MHTFGERLVSIRENKGISQKRLAEKLEISPTRLNYWEKDKRQPDIGMIKKISAVLDVSFVELLDWEEKETKIREGMIFDDYLKSLGFAIDHEVSEWHWEDETAEPKNKTQIPDKWDTILIKDGKSAAFTIAEFEELRNSTKDVIDTKFYKKLMDAPKTSGQ